MRKNSLLVAIPFTVVAGAAFAPPSPQVPQQPPPAVTTDKPDFEIPAKIEDKVQPNAEINVKSRFF